MTFVEKYAQKWALHIWVSETVSAQPNWSKAQPKSYFDWVSPWAFWVGPTQVTVIEINPTMRQGLGCLMYGPAGFCHMGWALPFGL